MDGQLRAESGAPSYPFNDPELSLEDRISDLLGRLTYEEKISQMLHKSAAIPRLGIPEYNWWNECLHGVARAGSATIFPQAIGLGATFDAKLMGRIGSAISDEARAKYDIAVSRGERGQYQGLTFWTPTINIFRDPRWGRGQETYGEDPLLSGTLGAALVKGLQGDDPHYLKVAACAKHFAVHSGPEKERHNFNAIVSAKDLYETYLPAFKILVDAGVESVMGAYNRVNGEPCCGHSKLLTNILREEWGFRGHVVSDCMAIIDFHAGHGVTKTLQDSAAMALRNGCDLNCGCCFEALPDALETGIISKADIDRACRRLFSTKIRLGMFDPPGSGPYDAVPAHKVDCAEHRALAREAAVKSIVLLKNNGVLPLKKDIRSIYVLGPNAATIDVLMGNYFGVNAHLVTFLEGITGRAGLATTVRYKAGCLLDRANENPIDWTPAECKEADVVIACLGLSPLLEGEEGDAPLSASCGDRPDIGLPSHQIEYLKRIREQGTPIIGVFAGGGPMLLADAHELCDALVFVWYPGEEGGNALADILFGVTAPSGRLPVSFPRSLNDLPAYEDYSMAGRTYRFNTEKPLYPFGFGLSYAPVTYHHPLIRRVSPESDTAVELSVTVRNEGSMAVEEVVQVYLQRPDAASGGPRFGLVDFTRVYLEAGSERMVSLSIQKESLQSLGSDERWHLDEGHYTVSIGGASPGERSIELGAAEPCIATFMIEAPHYIKPAVVREAALVT